MGRLAKPKLRIVVTGEHELDVTLSQTKAIVFLRKIRRILDEGRKLQVGKEDLKWHRLGNKHAGETYGPYRYRRQHSMPRRDKPKPLHEYREDKKVVKTKITITQI